MAWLAHSVAPGPNVCSEGDSKRLDTWVSDRGFVAVLTLRFIPVVPFNVLNYAAGLSGVSTRAYVPATVFGIAPGTFAYAAVGGTASDPLSAPFLSAVTFVVALVAIGALRAAGCSRATGCSRPQEQPQRFRTTRKAKVKVRKQQTQGQQ